MAEVRAGGSVVAGNPVLVGIGRGADEDGIAPVDAIGGAAYGHLVRVGDSQGRDDPRGMGGVEGYDRIAGRAEGALLVDGDAWQEAGGPNCAIIGGGGEAD